MGKTIKRKNKQNRDCDSYFSENDYLSSDGMITTIWGPPLWHFLHTISFNYPISPTIEQKKHYKQFILLLKYILPCKHCRDNFKKNLKDLPLSDKVFNNRQTFSEYIYNLHELVNKMLGKKSNLTYIQVRNRYERFRARCDKSKTKKKGKEKGCIHPLYGKKKNKCVLKIVDKKSKDTSF